MHAYIYKSSLLSIIITIFMSIIVFIFMII